MLFGDVRRKLLVGICSPQNLQRALPAETWTRCIQRQHAWAVLPHIKRKSGTFARQPVGQAMRSNSTFPARMFGLAVLWANLHASE